MVLTQDTCPAPENINQRRCAGTWVYAAVARPPRGVSERVALASDALRPVGTLERRMRPEHARAWKE